MTIKPIVDDMQNYLHEMPGEDMSVYPFEREYLEQETNSARYYIPGKGICVTASGTMLWYDMPQDEIGCFCFGETVLNKYLKGDFTDEELRAIEITNHLDEQAREIGLHVVWILSEGDDKQYAMFYSAPSEAYFKLPLTDIDNVNLITANIMAQHEPNNMMEAYEITVDSRGAFNFVAPAW